MAVSPVVLLDNVSEAGFGPIVEMGEVPVEFVGFVVEPSDGAQVDSVGTVGEGILIQCSHSPAFPQPLEGHVANWATGLVAMLPLLVENPEGNPAPQDITHLWVADVEGCKAGQPIVWPYMRAKLMSSLSAGTVKVKLYFK